MLVPTKTGLSVGMIDSFDTTEQHIEVGSDGTMVTLTIEEPLTAHDFYIPIDGAARLRDALAIAVHEAENDCDS